MLGRMLRERPLEAHVRFLWVLRGQRCCWHGLARLALPAASDGRLVHYDRAPTCDNAS
jgi:hypothetical protein